MIPTTSHFFSTNDGVRLHYLQAGGDQRSAKILILLPDWTMSGRLFEYQITAFSSPHRRVIALDPRGHGESSKPDSGYRLSRLAADLKDLIHHLVDESVEPSTIDIIAHGLSVGVVWNYIELFGQSRLHSLVLVDHPLCAVQDPSWSELECRNYGATLNDTDLRLMVSGLRSRPEQTTRNLLLAAFTDKANVGAMVQQSLQCPREAAAQLLWSSLTSDFCDLMSSIRVPTLCIGGTESSLPGECQSFIAAEMENGDCEILPGSHFMFYEEPEAFNVVVEDFLNKKHPS